MFRAGATHGPNPEGFSSRRVEHASAIRAPRSLPDTPTHVRAKATEAADAFPRARPPLAPRPPERGRGPPDAPDEADPKVRTPRDVPTRKYTSEEASGRQMPGLTRWRGAQLPPGGRGRPPRQHHSEPGFSFQTSQISWALTFPLQQKPRWDRHHSTELKDPSGGHIRRRARPP